MKNKKLFAILTLVCFMFTLMPVAAFAAETDADAYVSGAKYVNEVVGTFDDEVSVKVDEKVNVKVADGQTGAEYYFWAENADGDVEEVKATSETAIDFTFDTVGTYYVYAVNASVVNVADMAAKYYGKADIVDFIKDVDNYIDDCLTVKVKKSNASYELTLAEETVLNEAGEVEVVADNGWTGEEEVVVQLKKADGTAIKGEEITFTTNSSYVDVAVEDEITNRNGKVEITITATRAGDYKVYAHADNADKLTIKVHATADVYGDITTLAEPTRNIALGTDLNGTFYDIAFELEYADGTLIESDTEYTPLTMVKDGDFLYKVAVVDAPADSDLADVDAGEIALVWNDTANGWVLAGSGLSLDEEGSYTFKVTLENGASAKATVNVVEFDEAVRMILTMKANTVSYGETVEVKAVSYMDANGTMLTKAHSDYRAGEYMNIEFAATGKAVDTVNESTGAIKAKGVADKGDELVGTTITAFAINEDLELTATAVITVVDKAAGLKYQSTTADIAVNNKLIVNPVDEDGNVIAALDVTASTPSVYVLSAPANAAYSAEAKVTDTDEITVTFTASAAGEYQLQTVVRTEGSYLSSVDTITVGGTASDFEDVVVMSIGAKTIIVNNEVKEMLAAPVIKDGRTFVPFRAGLEALGATVEYDQTTQSVIAELNGVKVVMTIGEKVYTVNGVAKTADVAPYLNVEASTTMVPVRFVAEAFGITVTPLYAEDGTVADVLFAN